MCKAVSILITKNKKTYWKAGMDSHDQLQAKFVSKDSQLKDDKEPPNNTFARVEISPKNHNYLRPDEWQFVLDERVKPLWWNDSYEKPCWDILPKWKEKIYSQINMKEALNPIHPFKVKCPTKITKKHIALVKGWASVRASVWASVRASVGDSVRASVWASVWDSVWDSVRDSAWDSVWAYYSSLFIGIKKWKYCKNIKVKGYPFQSAVKLWKMGLVPAYDGKKWQLYGSPKGDGKIKVIWEGEI
jgi:hypothetical protein